jgi:hypothetical protein
MAGGPFFQECFVNDVFQGEWARRLCNTDKKDDLAPHFKKFYELVARHTHTLTSNSDPHRQVWGVIAAMADEIKRLEGMIAELQPKPVVVEQPAPQKTRKVA